MKAPGALSRRGEGTECLLKTVLEDRTGEWVKQVSVLQGISQGEREKEKERHGDPSSDGAKVL